MTANPFALLHYSNVYLTILALFCLYIYSLIKISLNCLSYFYIIRGNRKEAARISAEFYDFGQGHSEYTHLSITLIHCPKKLEHWNTDYIQMIMLFIFAIAFCLVN